jgi:hypothetical protein
MDDQNSIVLGLMGTLHTSVVVYRYVECMQPHTLSLTILVAFLNLRTPEVYFVRAASLGSLGISIG